MSFEAARRGDRRSVQIIIAIVVDLLDNTLPGQDTSCARVASNVLALLSTYIWNGDTSILRGHRLRTWYPEVVRACTRFLRVPRAPGEMQKLATSEMHLQTEQVCACDRLHNPILRELHATHVSLYKTIPQYSAGNGSVLRYVISTLALAYFSAVTDGSRSRVRTTFGKSARYDGTRQAWPSDVEDIAPSDIQSWTECLCAWVPYAPGFPLLQMINDGYRAVTSVGRPTIYLGTILPRAFSPIVQLLLTDEGKSQQGSGSNASMRRYEVTGDLIQCSHIIKDILKLHARQLAAILPTVRFDWASFMQLIHRCYMALARSKCFVEPEYSPQRAAYLSAFKDAAAQLSTAISFQWDRSSPAALEIASRASQLAANAQDPIASLAAFSQSIFCDDICGNVECDRTPVLMGQRLQVCSGCRHMYYCSAACQRRAWRYEAAPHKSICAMLLLVTMCVKVRYDPHGYVDSEEMEEEFRYWGADPQMASKVVDNLVITYTR